jgi:hypothetical protein
MYSETVSGLIKPDVCAVLIARNSVYIWLITKWHQRVSCVCCDPFFLSRTRHRPSTSHIFRSVSVLCIPLVDPGFGDFKLELQNLRLLPSNLFHMRLDVFLMF